MERQLPDPDALLRAVFDSQPGVNVCALDTDCRYTLFSPAHRDMARALWGTVPEPGACLPDLVGDAADRGAIRRNFARSLAGETFVLDEALGDPARGRRWFENGYAPLRDAAGTVIGTSLRMIDIDTRKSMEEALRGSNDRFRELIDLAVDGILLGTHDGIITDANACFCAMAGVGRDELVGRPIGSVLFTPESLARAPLRFDLLRAGETVVNERTILRPDGSTVEIEMRSKMMPDGTYQSIYRDITERTRAEEARVRLEGRLLVDRKLAAVGTLANGVAHEINNPLTGVINYAQLAMDRLPSAMHEERGWLANVIGEGNRIARIVRNLLVFSRQDRTEREPSDMGEVLERLLTLTSRLLTKEAITLEVFADAALPRVSCAVPQVQQAIFNLVNNARAALHARWPERHPDKRLRLTLGALEDAGRRWVRLTVRDYGTGIPASIRDRVFEPFFTTRDRATGIGLGLGLATSYGIVQEHGGRLTFETWDGEGTAFHLDLPAM